MPTFGFGSNEPNISPGGDRVGGFAQKIKELFADLYDKLNSVTWSNATQSSAGFMSVDDKKKLDCIYYGECSTAAATAAKVVTCAAFTLAAGSRVIVKFTVTNTAASPTLNVNSTGAKAIQYRGAAITAGYLAANRTYEFVYDGTNWQLVGDIDTNTDTHWTSHLYAGASNGTANAATTNGNTYLILCDNTTARDRRKIAGSGATTVTSDASGNITIASTNTTYSNMTAATASAAGKAGLVPAPAAGAQGKFLRGDATWQTPTNTTYSNFVKSGSSAAAGLVPSPGTTAGTSKYLREDATWQVPPNTTYSNFVKSGSGAKAGLVPSPGTTAGTTKYLREDATWQVPPNTVYTHPTTAGNKHIPAGGSSGQILKWSASGTAAWDSPTNSGAAPKPTASSGVGQWYRIHKTAESSFSSVTLPSGGTWAYYVYIIVGSDRGRAGIAAGGSSVSFGTNVTSCDGFAWRIV